MKRTLYVSLCLSLFFFVMSLPMVTQAASSSPSCSFSVVLDGATTSVDRSDTIFVRSGSVLGLNWASRNATNLTDTSKRSVPLAGFATTTIYSSKKYTYTATRGSSRAYCGVSVSVVSGSVTSPNAASSSKSVTLTGKVRGDLMTLNVTVTPFGTSTPTTSASVRVRNGGWTFPRSLSFPDGNYMIDVSVDKSGVRTVVATSTLTVGNPPPVAATTLVVVPVQLLGGGTARANTNVAVAYLQLINLGSATATISGISMTQTDNAPVAAVTQLSAVSDNGLARGSVGIPPTTPFVGQTATIPITLTLAPREMRLVTVKALMAPNLLPYLGTKLTLMTSSVTANAKIQSTFPIFGTIWTLGY